MIGKNFILTIVALVLLACAMCAEFTCPPPEEASPAGHYKVEGDCSKFYKCDGSKAYVMDCGTGTVFNPKNQNCDWPYNVPGC